MRERPPTTAERQRVILTQLYRPLSQPNGFGNAAFLAISFRLADKPSARALPPHLPSSTAAGSVP